MASISGTSAGSFTYDAAGNMLSYAAPFAGYSFAYGARNRQTQAFVGAIGTGFLINGLGQRIGQTITQFNASVPEFFFVHDEAGHLTGKYDGLGNPLWETVWLGDLPAAVLLQPGGRSYIAPDHLGSPHQITDANGVVVWLWHPDPFGNGDPTGAFSYELRFPGQFFDQGTRLHYNYFRDYDPRLGRYIESDPIGLAGVINTYAYVYNNPLTWIDPNGLDPQKGGRGDTGGSSGKQTDNPYKHCWQDPCDPNKIICRDKHTGKKISKPKPPDWDQYKFSPLEEPLPSPPEPSPAPSPQSPPWWQPIPWWLFFLLPWPGNPLYEGL